MLEEIGSAVQYSVLEALHLLKTEHEQADNDDDLNDSDAAQCPEDLSTKRLPEFARRLQLVSSVAVKHLMSMQRRQKRQRDYDGDAQVLSQLSGCSHSIAGVGADEEQLRIGSTLRHLFEASVPLPQAVLDTMTISRGVVQRKSAASATSTQDDIGYIEQLRRKQATARRDLYLGVRRNDFHVLVPRVSSLLNGEEPVQVPTPATIEMGELNVEAECAFLQRAIHVDTKLALSSAWIQLRDDLRSMQSKVQSLSDGSSNSIETSKSNTDVEERDAWIQVESCNHGMVVLRFRHALRVFLVLEMSQRRWLLQRWEWLIRTTLSPTAEAVSTSLTAGVELPESHSMIFAHLQRLFRDKGMSEGCMACLHCVAGVWMQLADEQIHFYVEFLTGVLNRKHSGDGGGAPTITVDRQLNSSYVAVNFTVGASTTPVPEGQQHPSSPHQRASSVSTKFFVSNGTVLHQRVLGTDYINRLVDDVLSLSSRRSDDSSVRVAVVDAVALLWEDWNMCLAERMH